jgi:hypothetical protein
MISQTLGKKLVRVHLKDGSPSIEGLLISDRGRNLKLLGAKLVPGNEAMDGMTVIPRENVVCWQTLD